MPLDKHQTTTLQTFLILGGIVAFIYVASTLRDMKGAPVDVFVKEIPTTNMPPPQWAERPLPNAEVLIVWEGTRSTDPFLLMHNSAHCVRQERLKTDAQGRVSVPSWWAGWGDEVREWRVYVNAPGFRERQSVTREAWVSRYMSRDGASNKPAGDFKDALERCKYDMRDGAFKGKVLQLCGRSVECRSGR